MADALSRNVHVGALTEQTKQKQTPLNNFSLLELTGAQHRHGVWSQVIHHLKSGDEVSLPELHILLSQFLLDMDGVLCRYWPNKKYPVEQFVIPEEYVPTILNKSS